jgi:hypothetical protein
MLDDSDIAPLSWDNDNCWDGIVSILLLFYFPMQFDSLSHGPFDSFNGFLIAFVGLIGVNNDFHEVRVEDKRMYIWRIYVT